MQTLSLSLTTLIEAGFQESLKTSAVFIDRLETGITVKIPKNYSRPKMNSKNRLSDKVLQLDIGGQISKRRH